MYPKIDIYVNGEYVCSTNKSASMAEAKARLILNPTYQGKDGLTRVENLDTSRLVCKWAGEK